MSLIVELKSILPHLQPLIAEYNKISNLKAPHPEEQT